MRRAARPGRRRRPAGAPGCGRSRTPRTSRCGPAPTAAGSARVACGMRSAGVAERRAEGVEQRQQLRARLRQRARQRERVGAAHRAIGVVERSVPSRADTRHNAERRPLCLVDARAGRGQQRQLADRQALGADAGGRLSRRASTERWDGSARRRDDRAACAPLGARRSPPGAAARRRAAGRRADRHRPVPRHPRRRRGAALAGARRTGWSCCTSAAPATCRRALRARRVVCLQSTRGAAHAGQDRDAPARADGRPPARREGAADLLRRGAPAAPRAPTSGSTTSARALDAGARPTPRAARSASCPRYRWLGALPHARDASAHPARARAGARRAAMEGGAHVVMEAVRSGTPVLASRIAGNVGMLGADYAGYFAARRRAGPRRAAGSAAATSRLCSQRPAARNARCARRCSTRRASARRCVGLLADLLETRRMNAPLPSAATRRRRA